jgi:hypothetical protein
MKPNGPSGLGAGVQITGNSTSKPFFLGLLIGATISTIITFLVLSGGKFNTNTHFVDINLAQHSFAERFASNPQIQAILSGLSSASHNTSLVKSHIPLPSNYTTLQTSNNQLLKSESPLSKSDTATVIHFKPQADTTISSTTASTNTPNTASSTSTIHSKPSSSNITPNGVNNIPSSLPANGSLGKCPNQYMHSNIYSY